MQASLAKWFVKAVGGLALNLVLLTVWVELAGIPASIAILPNFAIISLLGYVVTLRWIWPDGVTPSTLRGHARQYAGMQVANFTGKAANYAVYLVLLPWVAYQAAWVVGAGLTFFVTFFLNRWWWSSP